MKIFKTFSKLVLLIALLTPSVSDANINLGPPTKKIDLKLTKIKSNDDEMRLTGLGMIFSGAVYCTALLLEGNESYASAYKTSGNTVYRTVPPFYKQTPKNFYFLAGAAVMLTGITITIKYKR